MDAMLHWRTNEFNDATQARRRHVEFDLIASRKAVSKGRHMLLLTGVFGKVRNTFLVYIFARVGFFNFVRGRNLDFL